LLSDGAPGFKSNANQEAPGIQTNDTQQAPGVQPSQTSIHQTSSHTQAASSVSSLASHPTKVTDKGELTENEGDDANLGPPVITVPADLPPLPPIEFPFTIGDGDMCLESEATWRTLTSSIRWSPETNRKYVQAFLLAKLLSGNASAVKEAAHGVWELAMLKGNHKHILEDPAMMAALMRSVAVKEPDPSAVHTLVRNIPRHGSPLDVIHQTCATIWLLIGIPSTDPLLLTP
jgi:hypothetical protein